MDQKSQNIIRNMYGEGDTAPTWMRYWTMSLHPTGDIVQYLHQAGADINILDIYGYTAVMWAATGGHYDIVKYIHQAGADINIGNKWMVPGR